MTIYDTSSRGSLTSRSDIDTVRLALASGVPPMSADEYLDHLVAQDSDEDSEDEVPEAKADFNIGTYTTLGYRRRKRLTLALPLTAVVVLMALMMLTGQPGPTSASVNQTASNKAQGRGTPTTSAPSKPAIQPPAKAEAKIPAGYVAATKVGVLSAIVRDSATPSQAPISVAFWKGLVVQATGTKYIIGPGNYNMFASSHASQNAGYGAQAYLFVSILKFSGGNPMYYYRGTNGVVVEGLIPMTPLRGRQIAAQMGIPFSPYGRCDPKAKTQPVTCGPYNSLLVAARYMNDFGAALSANPKTFGAYKKQRLAGLPGGGPYLPVLKLADITCAWHREMTRAQCTQLANLALAWRDGTLVGSTAFQPYQSSSSFAQLLAQAKAELVREHWLK